MRFRWRRLGRRLGRRLARGASFTVPEASAEARQAAIAQGFLNKDLKYDDLNPVLQRTMNKVATPLTDRTVEQGAGVLEGDVL